MDGLLAALSRQTRRPDEVLVIDDGSYAPYRLPDSDLPLRLVRFEQNRGNTFVRTFAVEDARGDAVACMDCDIRPSDNWLEICCERLAESAIGLAAGTLVQDSGDDPVSRYLELFGDRFTRIGDVDFIPGGAWMIRKEVWRDVDGFGDHAERIRQDNVLCARLKDRGYKLFADHRATAAQIRSMSRTAAAAKLWRRFDDKIKAVLPQVPEHDFPRFFFDSLGVFSLRRTARLAELAAPELFAVELTYTLHVLFDLTAEGVSSGLYGRGVLDSLASRTRELLSPYPRLRATVCSDLVELGHRISGAGAGDAYWSPVFDRFRQLDRAGMFSAAENGSFSRHAAQLGAANA